jgi:signal transduction histidine kinase
LGIILLSFFLLLQGYAIGVRQLFGIKVILTHLLVGAIAILLLAEALISIPNWLGFSWRFILFLIFLYFGYLLIKSVLLEIKRREEIERIDKAKSEFISIASHQLRTPLTAVKGYISMILEGTYGN